MSVKYNTFYIGFFGFHMQVIGKENLTDSSDMLLFNDKTIHPRLRHPTDLLIQ